MVNLTQKQLAYQTDRDVTTIIRYEKSDTLDIRLIRDILDFFHKSHIIFTTKWLIQGIGEKPFFKEYGSLLQNQLENIKQPDIKKVYQEITFLENLNSAFTYLHITDNSMEPRYNIGDYVGGNLIPAADILKYNNTYCALYTNTDISIRRINIDTDLIICTPINLSFPTTIKSYTSINSFFMITWYRTINQNANF